MIHESYDQLADSGQQPRDRRLACQGQVRILCGLPPFQLLLSLPLANISQSGLAVRLDRDGPLAQQAPLLLEPGDYFDLQVEHDNETLPTIQSGARLVRVQPQPDHWTLGFEFEDTNPDVLGLMHELQTQIDRSERSAVTSQPHPTYF